jgi:hypothetical protein
VDQPALPAVLARFTTDVADELAATYDDQVVYPRRIDVERPGLTDGNFPSWLTPVLVIAVENQGVCAWGVPLDGDDDPPVLVGGELGDGTVRTVPYADHVEAYINARRWDRACLASGMVLQAQAEVLDDKSLAYLRARYEELPSTSGWPGEATYRFQAAGVRIMLWAGSDQCYWLVSGPDADRLYEATPALLSYSDLRSSLWSNDIAGQTLLDQIRRTR